VAGHAAAGRGKRRAISASFSENRRSNRRCSRETTPGQWLEHFPDLNWLIVLIGHVSGPVLYAGRRTLNAINLNIVNFSFLLLGFYTQNSARLMHGVQGATPQCGIILQFPSTQASQGSSLPPMNQRIADAFVGLIRAKPFRR